MSPPRLLPCIVAALSLSCFVDETGSGGVTSSGGTTSSSSGTELTTASTGAATSSTAGTGEPTAWSQPLDLTLEPAAEPEVDVPVLVRLRGPQFDYASAEPDGSDIRFVASLQSLEPLPFEVEAWDPAGESRFWVRLPEVGGDSSPTGFWVVYGDTGVPAPGSPTEVWENGFIGVWHFETDAETAPDEYPDSTGMGNSAARMNPDDVYAIAPGQVGRAVDLERNTSLGLGAGSEFNLTSNFTLEAWIYPNAVDPVASSRNVLSKFEAYQLASTGVANEPVPSLSIANGDPLEYASATGPDPLTATQWTYLVGTFDGDTLRLFQDDLGEIASETPGFVARVNEGSDLRIGNTFDGRIDEMRISAIARSPRWVEIQYLSATDNLLQLGSVAPLP